MLREEVLSDGKVTKGVGWTYCSQVQFRTLVEIQLLRQMAVELSEAEMAVGAS
jgi:hypothetical protein